MFVSCLLLKGKYYGSMDDQVVKQFGTVGVANFQLNAIANRSCNNAQFVAWQRQFSFPTYVSEAIKDEMIQPLEVRFIMPNNLLSDSITYAPLPVRGSEESTP